MLNHAGRPGKRFLLDQTVQGVARFYAVGLVIVAAGLRFAHTQRMRP